MKQKSRFHQRGAETVEFAFVAVFYFTLLFGVFEFARALYTWNVLTESTRRGARLAAVCPYKSPIPINVAVFNSRNVSSDSPIIPDLKTSHVKVRYLDSAGIDVILTAAEIDDGGLARIDFVEVSLSHKHDMLFSGLFGLFVPSWTGTLNSPTFQTTLPAESLGADPTFSPPAEETTCNF